MSPCLTIASFEYIATAGSHRENIKSPINLEADLDPEDSQLMHLNLFRKPEYKQVAPKAPGNNCHFHLHPEGKKAGNSLHSMSVLGH